MAFTKTANSCARLRESFVVFILDKMRTTLNNEETATLVAHNRPRRRCGIVKSGTPCRILNAGRGNPNFLNTTAREAFSHLNSFATGLAGKNGPTQNLWFRPDKKGIAKKLRKYLHDRCRGKAAEFLVMAHD